MNKNMRHFLHLFINIRKQGFIKNIKKGKNGPSLTFEKCLKKYLDNSSFLDLNEIEVRMRKHYSKFKVHLACIEPDFLLATYTLNEKYGYQPREKDLRYFYLEVDAIQKSRYLKHYFQLYVDELSEKIFLLIFDNNYNLVSNVICWSFEAIKTRFLIKLNTLALIQYHTKIIDNEEHYLYTSLTFYHNIRFDKIIWAIRSGIITIKFKINVNVTTNKIKNHGTSFCIASEHLYLLYVEKY